MFRSFKNQHTGLGRRMIECAENIARYEGYKKISITSGVGVRNYYKKYGYRLEGDYMTKVISSNTFYIDLFVFILIFVIATLSILYISLI